MRISYIISTALLLVVSLVCGAQGKNVVVDYNNPQKYIIGGVSVEGNKHFSPEQILQVTGLQKGMEVTVPSEAMSGIVQLPYLSIPSHQAGIPHSSRSVSSRDHVFHVGHTAE